MNWDSEERRRFVRVKCPCEITVSAPKKRVISANAVNISAGGLRAFLGEKLSPSTIIELTIYDITKEVITCTAKIVWVFTRKPPCIENTLIYDTGMEFCDIKAEHVKKIKRFVAAIASGQDPT